MGRIYVTECYAWGCYDNDNDHYYATYSRSYCNPRTDCVDNDASIHPGSTELCDGKNNDCNTGTPDGSGESWYGNACDGADTDLCTEGTYTCTGGAQSCSDTTGNTLEVCTGGLDEDCDGAIDCNDSDCPPCGETACFDGIDNDSDGKIDCVDPDCDGNTDGACDGADTDLCNEGVWTCSAGSKTCSDTTGNNVDTCDNTDNDCNPATADGSGESWYGTTCDGTDIDLCKEGTYSCTGGAQTCSDTTGNNVETCDNTDNDCNPATADGSGESWYGTNCDGADTDLCNEGTYTCIGGAQTCSDTTGNTVEVCTGGLDEDCDGATDCNDSDCPPCNETDCFDGIDNDSDGKIDCADPDCAGNTDGACDGADTDLCNEGVWTCSAGSKTCSDTTGNNVETCDNTDNDCNPATSDGSGESWYGNACDGADTDLCTEGTYTCTGGTQTCSDTTGNTVEVCTGGLDEDCDGATDCNDSDCTPCPKETACFDGIDNDSDGKIDCADPDCDGNTDGNCDGADTDLCKEGTYGCTGGAQTCSDTTGNTLEVCTGSLDEDCDGSTDCADSDCSGIPPCCPPVIKSTNTAGGEKDTYTTSDTVYATGSCLPVNTTVHIYIVANLSWTDGKTIPSDVSSDGRNTLQTTPAGTLGPAIIWQPPLTVGGYDIVLDVNKNGIYNAGIDAVDDPNHPGFTVIKVCTDSDGDTYNIEGGSCGPVDCDDSDPMVNPGVPDEVGKCNDGKDNDCDGDIDCNDSDCYGSPACPIRGGSACVGGIATPVNKFALVAPWIALVMVMVIMAIAALVVIRIKKRNV